MPASNAQLTKRQNFIMGYLILQYHGFLPSQEHLLAIAENMGIKPWLLTINASLQPILDGTVDITTMDAGED